MKKNIAVLIYDGCWGMSVFSVTDFFRIVGLLEKHQAREQSYHVEVVSIDGKDVRSASGHLLIPDRDLFRPGNYDLVVIPAIEGIRLSEGFEPDERVTVKFFETPRSVFLLPCSARKLLAVDCLERSAVVHSCKSLRCIR